MWVIWDFPGTHPWWFPGDTWSLLKEILDRIPHVSKPNSIVQCTSFFLLMPLPHTPFMERDQATGCWSCTPFPISYLNSNSGLPFLWHLLTAWGPEDHEPRSLYKRNQGISLGWLDCPVHTDQDACWIHERFFQLWRGRSHLQVKCIPEGLVWLEKDSFQSSCCVQGEVPITQLVNCIYRGPTGF